MRCADHALEYRKLADIKPYQKNPRKNDKAVTAVANSIRTAAKKAAPKKKK